MKLTAGGWHNHCPKCHLTFRLHSLSPAWRYCESCDIEFSGNPCDCGKEENKFRKVKRQWKNKRQ